MLNSVCKTGDNVKIISGDSKGTEGVVKQAIPSANKVIVEGVNVVKKHSKPTNTQPQGGIIDVERPISVTNVKVVSKSSDKKEDK
ncbi:50S ribosomal protein L24 [Companilactobacillus nodensis]|uniref:50S ribosomal protein L24 n=1 Tax=Companilactobacillus nodensis TaxID=460870 RepID=UPI000468382C|nr:50S ribosomal protein L24 [Companilactobacillus nodensis]